MVATVMSGLTSLWSLEGRWQLVRKIVHADGAVHRLEGEALFHRAGPRLIQDEEGALVLGNQTIKATRRYVWTASEGRLDVFFDDMRPFHSVPLHVAAPETVHLCDPDRYQVAYDFGSWPEWRSVWQVEGPRKDYVMTNVFTRIEP
jgi:hypothetical protein